MKNMLSHSLPWSVLLLPAAVQPWAADPGWTGGPVAAHSLMTKHVGHVEPLAPLVRFAASSRKSFDH